MTYLRNAFVFLSCKMNFSDVHNILSATDSSKFIPKFLLFKSLSWWTLPQVEFQILCHTW